jgi:predicted protein tyrosine phosphatase
MRQNALWNCKNPNQGQYERVLCICSAGLLRSPTVAWILSNHDYNTRSAGMNDYALIQIDDVLVEWADKIVFVDQEHLHLFNVMYPKAGKTCIVLDIPDNYGYRSSKLVDLITTKLKEKNLI